MKYRIALSATLAVVTLAAFAFRHAGSVAGWGRPAVAASPLRVPVTPPPIVLAARPSSPASVAASVAPPAGSTPALEEAAFMRDLRVLAEMDALLAIERAREGAARFGASADAPERRSILIHALSDTGRAAEARGEAEAMVNECPDSTWVREVERFTGAHRHRNVRLAANGQLEYW
jgi:hypothetical protein